MKAQVPAAASSRARGHFQDPKRRVIQRGWGRPMDLYSARASAAKRSASAVEFSKSSPSSASSAALKSRSKNSATKSATVPTLLPGLGLGFQFFAAARQARHHCADGRLEGTGQGGVALALEVPHGHQLAAGFAQGL